MPVSVGVKTSSKGIAEDSPVIILLRVTVAISSLRVSVFGWFLSPLGDGFCCGP